MGPLRSFQLHGRPPPRHHMAFRALLPERDCLLSRSAMALTGLCGVIVGSLRPRKTIQHNRLIWRRKRPPQGADRIKSTTVRSALGHHA
jgi:hypothetical protein